MPELDRTIIERYGINLENYDTVAVRHRNIVEYINGTRPEILTDFTNVRKAVRDFMKAHNIISEYGSRRVCLSGKLFVLAFLYPNVYIVSTIMPRIPDFPSAFGVLYKGPDEDKCILVSNITQKTRQVYVKTLRYVSRAVIVKYYSSYSAP